MPRSPLPRQLCEGNIDSASQSCGRHTIPIIGSVLSISTDSVVMLSLHISVYILFRLPRRCWIVCNLFQGVFCLQSACLLLLYVAGRSWYVDLIRQFTKCCKTMES